MLSPRAFIDAAVQLQVQRATRNDHRSFLTARKMHLLRGQLWITSSIRWKKWGERSNVAQQV